MSVGRLVMGLLLLWPPTAVAQTTDAATRELVERLLLRIDTLEKRVAQLENPGAPATPVAAVTAPKAAEDLLLSIGPAVSALRFRPRLWRGGS